MTIHITWTTKSDRLKLHRVISQELNMILAKLTQVSETTVAMHLCVEYRPTSENQFTCD